MKNQENQKNQEQLEHRLQGLSIKNSKLTKSNLLINFAQIKIAFPGLKESFYDVLCDRLIAKRCTDEELTDAVGHVIDTCEYPNPQVANFMNYIIKNRIPPEERKEEISEDRIIINPEKEREQEEFNARLLTRTDLGDTPEEEHEMFK